MPTIHGVNASPFVRKVRAIFEEKGLPYELNPIVPFAKTEEFLKLSPLGKIPVYQDGDFVLPDSSCIALYVERRHPTPALFPEDDRDFGAALFLEEYADTKLTDTLTTVFVQRIINKVIMKGESDEALCREVIHERVPPLLDYLESRVGDREWLIADRFSIADVAVASPFVNYAHAGESVDQARWPKLAGWLARTQARPSFSKLIEEERAAFRSM